MAATMILRIIRDLAGRFESSRLSTKVLVLSAFTTLLPLVFLTALLDHANVNSGRQLLLGTLQHQSAEQAAQVDDRLRTWPRVSAQLAEEPTLRSYLQTRRPELAPAAAEAMKRFVLVDPDFRAAMLFDAGGQVAVATDPAAYTNPGRSGAGILDRARAGQSGVTDPVVGKGVAPEMFAYAPVTAGGSVVGVLVFAIDGSRLTGFSNPVRLPDDRFGMLVDGNGVVVGYNGPSPERVLYHTLGAVSPEARQRLQTSGAYDGGPLEPLGMTDLGARLQATGAAGADRFSFPPSGRAVEAGYSPVQSKPWRVAVLQDESAFIAGLRSSTLGTVGFFLAAAIPVIVMIFMVLRLLERTERRSLHDDLTGLPNRRYFEEILQREFGRAQRTRRPLSIINFDLDRFKAVNDEHGHAVGDEVLRSFAGLLSRQVRSIDLPVRYGGEEFVVLLPDTDKDGAQRAAEKVRLATEELRLGRRGATREQRHELRLTVSAGVASFPEDGLGPEILLRRADQAMYLAKSLGRNQVIGFGSPAPLGLLTGDPERITDLVRNANRATVEALVAAIDARDRNTHGHSRRVADIAALVGEEMGVSGADADTLSLGALLHDLGAIGVPEHVLRKSTDLTDMERVVVRDHTLIGHEMVRQVPFLREVAPIILHHHENFDGTGYPEAMRGEAIPLAARIVKVADAFDAMTTDRTYRDARPVEWALGELRRNAGTQFDPEVVEAIVSAHAKHRLRRVMIQAAS